MSIGWMLDDIITNILKNKAENQPMEVVDSYCTKHCTTIILCTESHFNIFIGRKILMKVLMFYVHVTMFKKIRQYLSNMLMWYGQSDV